MRDISTYTGWIGCGILLLIYSIQDIRKKNIDLRFALLLLPFAAVQLFLPSQITMLDRLFGALFGVLFLGISKLTKGKIGLGDGWMILFLGVMLGFWQSLQIILLSFLGLMILAIILLTIFHASRNKTMPFLPFLFCGLIIYCLFGGS